MHAYMNSKMVHGCVSACVCICVCVLTFVFFCESQRKFHEYPYFQRRAFLEEALTGMTIDVARKIADGEKVTYPSEKEEEALDTINEYVEDLNYAIGVFFTYFEYNSFEFLYNHFSLFSF